MAIDAATSAAAMVEGVRSAGFDFVTGVPDSGLADFTLAIEATPQISYVPGTREDNCVALAAGAYLAAGAAGLVVMKSAGIGTCVDALSSLAVVYRIPMVLFVSWAGHAGRDIPHHNVIGEPLPALLDALGIPRTQCDIKDGNEVVAQLRYARSEAMRLRVPVAVLGVPEGLEER
jgi:sulfopyruvate decarboxylase subunit alpha